MADSGAPYSILLTGVELEPGDGIHYHVTLTGMNRWTGNRENLLSCRFTLDVPTDEWVSHEDLLRDLLTYAVEQI